MEKVRKKHQQSFETVFRSTVKLIIMNKKKIWHSPNSTKTRPNCRAVVREVSNSTTTTLKGLQSSLAEIGEPLQT